MKKYYFLKLNPPRVSFMQDMSADEKSIMQQHVEYWKPYVADGTIVVLGPVLTPDGGFGMAVIGVNDEAHLQALISKDPANGLNSYEIFPMKAVSKYIVD
jgi:uncharacterized protein